MGFSRAPRRMGRFSLVLLVLVASQPASKSLTPCAPLDNQTECRALVAIAEHTGLSADSTAWAAPDLWLSQSSMCTWKGVGCAAPNGRIARLDLSRQRIQSTVPDAGVWERLSHLEDLDLGDNHFHGPIPACRPVRCVTVCACSRMAWPPAPFRAGLRETSVF